MRLGLRRTRLPQRFLWIVLIGLGVALGSLVLSRNQDGVSGLDLNGNDYASLVAKVAILLVIVSTMLMMFRDRLTLALQAALFWAAVMGALAAVYTYRAELRQIGDRVLAELVPGRPVQVGRTVEIARGNSGEFQVQTMVNGAPVAMVLDTGASSMVLTQEAARVAGLPLQMLSYTVEIDTANGHSRAAAVNLDRVAVGNIVERAVPALIAQPGHLKESLLGMTFLNRLESYEMRGDRLLMRAKP